MPVLTTSLSLDGPVVTLAVAVSDPRRQALLAAKLPVPVPVIVRGLIDTGASCTAIDPRVFQQLGLTPTGTVPITTPSTGATPHVCNQFDVALAFLMQPQSYHIKARTIPVIESHFGGQGIQALIGRDALSDGIFIYNSQNGTLSLAF